MTTNQVLTEQDILNDSLISEKHMTDSYNLYAGECVNQQLRSTMLGILNDVHTIQADIFSTMQQNGWYQVEPAEQQKVQKARQKFSAS
jgi:spore coat protein CotF